MCREEATSYGGRNREAALGTIWVQEQTRGAGREEMDTVLKTTVGV